MQALLRPQPIGVYPLLYTRAIDSLEGSGLDETGAELWLALAMTYHEQARAGAARSSRPSRGYEQAAAFE